MTDLQQHRDQEHLDAALVWLRLRLRAAAGRSQPVERAEADGVLHRNAAGRSQPVELAEADRVLHQTASAAPAPAAVRLAASLGLSRFELSTLLLCYFAELDPELAHLCAQLQGDRPGPPTFAVALAALPDPSWDAIFPAGPLRRHRLLEIQQQGALPLVHCPLRLDERIANELRGLRHLDERLAPYLEPLREPPLDLPPSHRAVLDAALTLLRAEPPPTLALLGPDPAGTRLLVGHLAARLGRAAYRLSLDLAPRAAGEIDALVRLWTREALLAPSLLLVDARGLAAPEPALSRLLAQLPAPVLIDSRDMPVHLSGAFLPLDLGKPTAREQHGAWRELAGLADAGAARLGGHFDLGLPDIARAVELVRAGEPAGAPVDLSERTERLFAACLGLTRPRLDNLAARLRPRAGWDDLVLHSEAVDLLRQLADQLRHRAIVHDAWGFGARLSRGAGVTALFSGESGTGKTLAAEVIARDLGLDLYRVDLSQVVSKYIGETEKNLRRLFDAAEDAAAVLFFDEADALFGKRSEVRDSHDRFANIETGYLLQRVESYRGLAILATNLRDNLDIAFLRRLRFIIHFPFPGPAERAQIWRRLFPAACDTSRLDFDALAEINLTGGHIANVAINAAFLAARAGGPLTMHDIHAAARAEFRKLTNL